MSAQVIIITWRLHRHLGWDGLDWSQPSHFFFRLPLMTAVCVCFCMTQVWRDKTQSVSKALGHGLRSLSSSPYSTPFYRMVESIHLLIVMNIILG